MSKTTAEIVAGFSPWLAVEIMTQSEIDQMRPELSKWKRTQVLASMSAKDRAAVYRDEMAMGGV